MASVSGNIAYPAGVHGAAFGFNGDGSYVDTGAQVFGTSDFTVSFSLRTIDTGIQFVFGNRSTLGHGNFFNARLWHGALNVELDQSGSNYNPLNGHTLINDGDYHQIVVTRSGTLASVYIDGLLEMSGSTSGVTNLTSTAPFVIGSVPFVLNEPKLTGSIDDFRIFSEALSLNEIRALIGGDNVIQGNWIGTNAAGNVALGNGVNGVSISGSADNLIGGAAPAMRNIISGNTANGVSINGGGSTGNVVAGNYVGLNVDGTQALGNQQQGIYITGGASNNTIGGLTSTPGTGLGNVVSANGYSGIIVLGSSNNVIQGNIAGLNAAGNAVLGNTFQGVGFVFGGTGNTVGGTAPGARNVISGNNGGGTQGGMAIGAGVTNTLVQGNYIGTDITGTIALGNTAGGVEILGASNNTIGGNTAAARNVISGNSVYGISILNAVNFFGYTGPSTGNTVAGNYIGTASDGTSPLANSGDGVIISNGANNNTIGGISGTTGNVIAFSALSGITVDGATTLHNSLRQNSLFANSGGSIALTNGGNSGQVAPVIVAAVGGDSTRIIGTLAAGANTSYVLEFFGSPTAGDAKQFLGSLTVTTNDNGNSTFEAVFDIPLAFGSQVTATATRLDTGDTSALSPSVAAAAAIITGFPSAISEGTPVTLTAFTAADPGGGQSLAYDWDVLKNGVEFARSVEASITFVPDDEGTYSVRLTVINTQSTNATVGPLSFDVINADPAVQIVGAPSTVAVGATVSLHSEANDSGAADVLSYAWTVRQNDENGPILASGAGPDFTFGVNTGGLLYVSLTVTDGDGGSDTRSLVIFAQGGAPAATVLVPPTGQEGTPVRATAEVADLIRTDFLDYQWSVFKSGIAYPFTLLDEGSIEFVPDDNALYQIGLTVMSSGTSYDATPAYVDVLNVDPEAEMVGVPETAQAGIPVTVTGVARDRGTADLHTFQWEVIGSLAVPGGTGPSFTFTPPAAGEYVLRLTVRDDDGGTSTVARDLVVEATAVDVSITGAGDQHRRHDA